MKIRYLALFYSIIMAGVLLFILHISGLKMWERDMVYYNGQLHMIEQELEEGKDRGKVEEQYSVSILMLEDEDYRMHLNRLMKQDAVILDYYRDGMISGKIAWIDERNHYQEMRQDLLCKTEVVWGLLLISGYLLLVFVYIYMIRPFQKLKDFSSYIAKGNFDFPLPVKKNNFFGAFTESFDIMREELKRAKEGEYQANRSKKEIIAELSHDIKTPVSTIKATCEVMQLKGHDKDTLEKLGIIAAKADMVDNLVSNMFHATLDELEVLAVETREESSLCIVEMIHELKYYDEILFGNDMPGCLVYIDKVRLQQVIDNIVNNSFKYAGTAVTIWFKETKDGIRIRMADKGRGVPEDELVLITGKFYRGSNAAGKAGTGLGLYLSNLFMERMGGGMECYNDNGFVVELFVRKV